MKKFNHLMTVIGVATAVQFSGCSRSLSEPEAIASAKLHISQREFNHAGIELKTLLQQNPNSAEARYLFGKVLSEKGEPVLAELELRKALELKQPDTDVLPLLMRALLQQQQYKRVIDDYAGKSLGVPLADAELKTALATAYLGINRKADARAALTAAAAALPHFAPAQILEAQMSADAGDIDGALQRLGKVTSDDPKNSEAWRILGDFQLYGKTDGEGALASYGKAVSLNPDDLLAHSALIAFHISRNELDAADRQLAQLRKLRPNHPQVRFFEAQLAFTRKQYPAARDLIAVLLRQTPTNPILLQLAGANDLALNLLSQAEAHLTKAIQLYPNFSAARLLLARAHLRGGQPAKALSTLSPMLDQAEPSAAVLSLAGEAQLTAGDPARAQQLFERAVKSRPNDAKLQLGRALSILARGQADTAFGEFERIAATDTGTDADMALITAMLQRRDMAGAERAIAALERKRPNSAFVEHWRGEIQLRQGNDAAARASFERALVKDKVYFPSLAGLAALDQGAGQAAAAQLRFESVLKNDPKHVPSLLALASLRAANGGTKDETAKLLGDAKAANPTDVQPRLALAENYLRFGDAAQSLAEAREAEAMMPNSPAVLDLLGRAQIAAGDSQQALVTLGKWVSLQPKAALPNIRLAELHASRKNWEAALLSYKRAQALEPNSALVLSGMARMQVAAGRTDQALALLREVQAKRPTAAISYALEGDIEARRRRWDAAAAAYRTALGKPDANADIAEKLYLSQLSAGRPDAAEAAAETWIKAHPKDAAFVFNLGRRAMERNDLALAEQRFREVLKLQSENAPALNNIAWIMLQQHRKGAAALAEKASALAPDAPQMLDTFASALAEEGQMDRALTVQKSAISKAGAYSAPFQLNLAKLYIKHGSNDLALIELDKLSALTDQPSLQTEVMRLRQSIPK